MMIELRGMNKGRELQEWGWGLQAWLEARGIKATVDDNTDCDLPHLLVAVGPTSQWPDGRFLQIDTNDRLTPEDVLRFFSGAA